MYARPGAPPATSMMCGTLSWSAGPWIGVDHVAPRSVENDSHPRSLADPSGLVPCVSQVAYRLPPASRPIAPSIHHSESDIVWPWVPTRTGVDQVTPWMSENVK